MEVSTAFLNALIDEANIFIALPETTNDVIPEGQADQSPERIAALTQTLA